MEPVLIAVGVIVFVLLVSLTGLGTWMMRRRGLTFTELITGRKDYTRARLARRPSISPSFTPDWKTTSSDSWDQESLSISKPTTATKQITPPPPVILQNNHRLPPTTLNDPTTPKSSTSFLEDATPPRHSALANHSRNVSLAPSLYSLAEHDQNSANGATRLSTTIPPPPETSAASFQQFMANRRHTASRNGRLSATSARVSTTTTTTTPRDSTASTKPRFRTVDSWVGQQSNAIADERLQQHVDDAVFGSQALGPASQQGQAPRRKIGHVAQGSDATVFRAHPGTEVVIPRGSLVPSEILDGDVGAPSAFEERGRGSLSAW
ncbi:hypothetical protein K490DRAFT_65177 [Saccharata proteae CBS 121410]|uniref:Uncharacterized protein n=1 Tax=Saccharata proteae CBS 121410 TaxID=1314787 RepID=A0A9P4M0G7_9PEZI|nr:hypothetical protein K490DRAFT_65177 [Saccharata proteae CBS 121410]